MEEREYIFSHTEEEIAVKNKPNYLEEKFKQSQKPWEVVRYIIFLIVFYNVIAQQLKVDECYNINNAVHTYMTKENSYQIIFDEIYNVTHVLDWLTGPLLHDIALSQTYSERILHDEEELYIAQFNKLITDIHLSKKQISIQENVSNRFNDYIENSWKDFEVYKQNHEFKNEDEGASGPFGIWTYVDYAFDFTGGFVMTVPQKDLYEKLHPIRTAIRDLNLVNSQTALIDVEFVLYNGHYELFTFVKAKFDIFPTGYVAQDIQVRSVNINLYSEPEGWFRGFLEICLMLYVFFYMAVEIVDIKSHEYLRLDQHMTTKDKCKRIFLSILERLYTHYQELWNWIDLIWLSSSFIAIIYWIQIITNKFYIDYTTGDPRDFDNHEIIYGFDKLVQLIKVYERLGAVISLFVAIKLLKYLSYFRRVNLLYLTIMVSRKEIFGYLILMAGFVLSFTFLAFALFATQMEALSTLKDCLMYCLIIFSGNMEQYNNIKDKNIRYASLFFVPYTFMMFIIFSSMFTAMNVDAFRGESDELERYYEIQRSNPKFKLHWIYRTKAWCHNLVEKCRNKCNKTDELFRMYEAQQNKEKLEKQQRYLDIHSGQTSLLDANNYSFNVSSLDNNFLTDKQVKKGMNQLKTIVGSKYISMLFYLMFMGLLIGTSMLQLQISMKYHNQEAIRNAILNPVFEVDPDLNLERVTSYSTFFLWFNNAFPTIFQQNENGDYYVAGHNYLVGQDILYGPYRITPRRVNVVDNDSNFDVYVRKRRDPPNFDPQALAEQDEDTETYVGPFSDYTYEYESNDGYFSLGGYVQYLSIQPDLRESLEYLIGDEVLDNQINSFVIEFITYNGNQQLFNIASIVFYFVAGGEIKVIPHISPIKVKLYLTEIDYIRGVMEFILFCCVMFQIIRTISHLHKRGKKFDKYEYDLEKALTQEQNKLRNLQQPKQLRKFFAIIDVFTLVELVFYTLFLFDCVLYIVLVNYSEELQLELRAEDTDYFKKITELEILYDFYIKIRACTLLVAVAKSMRYLQMNARTAFLGQAIRLAMNDLVYYFLLCGTILFGFYSMTYVAFGKNVEQFSTLFMSAMSIIEMFFGAFDYYEMDKADGLIAPVFFIIYLFLVMFILLNIFVAILERAYEQQKERNVFPQHESKISICNAIWSYIVNKVKNKKQKPKRLPEENLKPIDYLLLKIANNTERPCGPLTFGEIKSENIIYEHEFRKQYQDNLKDIFYAKGYNRMADLENPWTRLQENDRILKLWNYYWKITNISKKTLVKAQNDNIKHVEKVYSQKSHEDQRPVQEKLLYNTIHSLEDQIFEYDKMIKNMQKKVDFIDRFRPDLVVIENDQSREESKLYDPNDEEVFHYKYN